MNIDKIYNEVIEKLQTEFGWSSLEQLSGMHEELVQDVIKAINLVKNNGVLDDVINCLKVGQKVDWQGKMFYVQEDDGGDRILISNHLDDIVPFYNDWWVDRNEVNCL